MRLGKGGCCGAPEPQATSSLRATRLPPGFRTSCNPLLAPNGWLPDGVLLQQIDRLARIPGVLIHGRLDVGTPLITPWQLAKRWPGSELVIVDRAGHDTRDPGMSESIVAAIEALPYLNKAEHF